MRLLHFLEYDISEGLIRFWRRYLWLIVLVFITCLLLDRASGDYLGMYGESWSPLGYIVNAFWGQRPFHFNQNTPDQFRIVYLPDVDTLTEACTRMKDFFAHYVQD